MTTTYYTVVFDFEGIHYEGRLSPEFKHGHSQPASWHTVLNDVFYGYLHKNEGLWEVNEQRPAGLTKMLGTMIDGEKYQLHSTDE